MTQKLLQPHNPLEDLSFSNSIEYPNLFEPCDNHELPPNLRSNSKPNYNNKTAHQPKEVVYNEKFESASKKALQNDKLYWNSFKGDDARGIRTTNNCPVNQKPNNVLTSRTVQDASHQGRIVVAKENKTQGATYGAPAMLNIYKKRGSKQVEPRVEAKDLPNSFKSFEIIHDDGLTGWNISTVGQDPEEEEGEIYFTEEKERVSFHEFMEEKTKETEAAKRVFLKNPGIGSLITEGTKKIDKIHKMLEGHRKNAKSTSSYLVTEVTETNEELHNSEIIEQPRLNQQYVFRKEEVQPEYPKRAAPKQEVQVKKISPSPRKEDAEALARFGRFSFSSEENRLSEKKEKQKSIENREVKGPAEWSFTEEPFVEQKEKGTRREKEHADKEDLLDSIGKDKKSLNSMQREFASARANALRDRTSLENNKQLPKPQVMMSNKAKSFLEESNQKASRRATKENICMTEKSLDKKPIPSKNVSGFLSIDMTNQKEDFLPKNYKLDKPPAGMSKGSYLKKFLEYKEKRKFKNPIVEAQTHRPTETPQKSFKSSRSSNVSAFTRETISERHSNRQVKEDTIKATQKRIKNRNMDASTGVDSSDVNALTDRSGAQGNLSTPNSKQAAKNGSSGKNTRELRPWQPYDEKSASKNEEKPNQSSLAEQIAKLQLNFVKEIKKDKARQSLRQKNSSITHYPQDLSSEHHTLTEEAHKQSLFGGSMNSVSLKTSRGPHEKSLKSSMLSHREGSSSGYELREMLKPKGSISKNYKDILQTSPNFATITEDVLSAGVSRGHSHSTQESLLKSVKLRQEIWRKMHRGNTKGSENEKDDTRTSIYSKSLKWLLDKQQKLEKMHNQEIEDEMRECTFKPQLLAKELSLRADLMNDLSGSMKMFERIVKS